MFLWVFLRWLMVGESSVCTGSALVSRDLATVRGTRDTRFCW